MKAMVLAFAAIAAPVAAQGASAPAAQAMPAQIRPDETPAPAAPATPYASLAALPVPVVAGDIVDRPYTVIGHVHAEVRKATMFSHASSNEKVYRELWERGKKLGADAVIHATAGRSKVTGISWGSRDADGDAIKFTAVSAAPATPVQ